MKFISLITLCLLFAFSASSARAAAECSVTGGNWSVTGTVNFQPDDEPGTESDAINTVGTLHVNCSGATLQNNNFYFMLNTAADEVGGFMGVYPTNLYGIGVIYFINIDNLVGFSGPDCAQKDYRLSARPPSIICNLPPNASASFDITGYVKFIKTKPDTDAGVISTIPVVTSQYRISGINDYFNGPMLWSGNSSVTTNSLGCQLTNSEISVPFGNIQNSAFQHIGYTTQANHFSLALTCDAGANINVTLRGVHNPDTSDQSVLALSNAEGGAAEGIGVQILYDDKPLIIDEALPLKQSAGGEELLSFAARYFQTKSTVTAGTADTVATLDLTYQ